MATGADYDTFYLYIMRITPMIPQLLNLTGIQLKMGSISS